jgi:hypothetical protein
MHDFTKGFLVIFIILMMYACIYNTCFMCCCLLSRQEVPYLLLVDYFSVIVIIHVKAESGSSCSRLTRLV